MARDVVRCGREEDVGTAQRVVDDDDGGYGVADDDELLLLLPWSLILWFGPSHSCNLARL